MSIVLAGGIVGASILALLFIPAAYRLLRSGWHGRHRRPFGRGAIGRSRRLHPRRASNPGSSSMKPRILSALHVLLLAACTTVGPDYEAPESRSPTVSIPLRATRTAPSTPGVRADWWHAFGDPLLVDYVEQAVAGTPRPGPGARPCARGALPAQGRGLPLAAERDRGRLVPDLRDQRERRARQPGTRAYRRRDLRDLVRRELGDRRVRRSPTLGRGGGRSAPGGGGGAPRGPPVLGLRGRAELCELRGAQRRLELANENTSLQSGRSSWSSRSCAPAS